MSSGQEETYLDEIEARRKRLEVPEEQHDGNNFFLQSDMLFRKNSEKFGKLECIDQPHLCGEDQQIAGAAAALEAGIRHVDPKAAYGATKPSVALIPSILEIVAALAAEDGAKKYGGYNYREGHPVEVMTYANAAKRHLQAFIDGEDFTSDTGVPNLGGVIMCCGIILDIMSTGVAVDNRPPKGKASEIQDAGKAWKRAVEAGESPVDAAHRILGPVMGVKR